MEREGIQPAIAITNLEKIYVTQDGARIPALGPVSIVIHPHEFVSVVGPSGCGKSTLLKIAAGLIPRSSGSLKIHGEEVTSPRRDVGLVFQSPVLLPWKTILENILLPIEIRHQPIADFKPRAMDLLQLVGLEGFHDRYPHELSGGMQQRAAIVRALVCDPDILLMDEPFGALDAITRDQMNVELLAIWARTKKTVVLGARPGLVIEDFVVDLPRPRHIRHMALPEFGQATTRIRLALERGSVFQSFEPAEDALGTSA